MSGQRVIVTGDGGMLARAFRAVVPDAEFLGIDALDITNAAAVNARLKGAATVINCAAYTNVDGAESEEAAAHLVNADGPANLAAACKAQNATLLHFSTDYVFPGNATEPYTPEQAIDPLGAYGRTKAEGEHRIRESGCDYLIVRTSWLYAPWAKNFVSTMAMLTRDKDALKVVNDQRGRPTSAEHLAATAWALFMAGERGTHHVTDGGECTWFDLACAVRDGLGHTCNITPCTTDEFPRPAPRPAYSVLDLTETERAVGGMPGWRENLAAVLPRLEID
ncbi:MAG: dTDP-4-dehydrorhamnose reductase [Planctomycetota bacterium]